jgi:hypothetical protein
MLHGTFLNVMTLLQQQAQLNTLKNYSMCNNNAYHYSAIALFPLVSKPADYKN